MKAFQLDGSNSIGGIRAVEMDVPKPRRGQVLVKMRAASLNYLDLKIAEGRFSRRPAKGLIPLSDGAGEVVEVGQEVSAWRTGDRVVSTFFPRWISGPLPADGRSDEPGATRDGMLAEYVMFEQDALVAAPSHLSFAEASTLTCAGLTAWVCLTGGARLLLPGETVLTQGTGGVSTFAVQFAKLAGARVIATTSDDGKAERLKALGADHVVNYRKTPQWSGAVKNVTANQGADHIIELAGSLENSIAASAINAQINIVGVPEDQTIDPAILMRGIFELRRITVGSRASFEAMNRAIELHRLRPVVDRVFEFADVQAAYRHLESKRHFGKVVVTIA